MIPQLDLINTFVAIIGLIVTVLTFMKSSRKKSIIWDISDVQYQNSLEFEKELPYTPFQNKTVSILTVINAGNCAVLSEDFETPLILKPKYHGEVEEYFIFPGDERKISEVTIEGEKLLITPRTLNKNETFTLVFSHSYIIQGHFSILLEGHVRNINHMRNSSEVIFKKFTHNALGFLLGGYTILYIYSVNFYLYIFSSILIGLTWLYFIYFRIDKYQKSWEKQWGKLFSSKEDAKSFMKDVIVYNQTNRL